jgi:hypothetical protein
LSHAGKAVCSSSVAVAFLGFGWPYIADRFEEAAMVEPVDPFERGELDGFQRTAWPSPADDLGL